MKNTPVHVRSETESQEAKQRPLRTDLRRSVSVTTAIQLVSIPTFTVSAKAVLLK